MKNENIFLLTDYGWHFSVGIRWVCLPGWIVCSSGCLRRDGSGGLGDLNTDEEEEKMSIER